MCIRDRRIGVSTRLTKLSLIHNTNIEISEVEQIWHGMVPPYIKLLNWIFEKVIMLSDQLFSD